MNDHLEKVKIAHEDFLKSVPLAIKALDELHKVAAELDPDDPFFGRMC